MDQVSDLKTVRLDIEDLNCCSLGTSSLDSELLRIFCSESRFLISEDFDFDFPATYSSHPQLTQQQFDQQVHHQNILIVNDLLIDQAVFANNPELKLIALCSTGYDQVNLDLARQYAVKVCNIQGYASDTVSEHTMLLILALMKNLKSYQSSVSDGQWWDSQGFCLLNFPILELKTKNLVIIGKGEIGQAVALKAQAFGMRVIYAERKNSQLCRPGYLPFEHAVQQADVISLHCTLTAENRQMIDLDVIKLMKPSCCLVNVSRGGLVNEMAVCAALEQGLIAGYAADVMQVEPPPHYHPFIELGTNYNIILTPHIAWASTEARWRMFNLLNQNINLNIRGVDQHRVA